MDNRIIHPQQLAQNFRADVHCYTGDLAICTLSLQIQINFSKLITYLSILFNTFIHTRQNIGYIRYLPIKIGRYFAEKRIIGMNVMIITREYRYTIPWAVGK